MAVLKKEIENRFLASEAMQNLYPEGPTDEEKLVSYINIGVTLLESGTRYDVHECVVTIKQDKFHFIKVLNVVQGMTLLEEPWGLHYDDPYPHILKVVTSGVNSDKEKKIEVKFTVINNMER